MRSTLLAALGAAGLLAATAAYADQATTTSAQSANNDPLICKRVYHEGILTRQTDCRSQREWDLVRQRNQRDFETYLVRSYSSPR